MWHTSMASALLNGVKGRPVLIPVLHNVYMQPWAHSRVALQHHSNLLCIACTIHTHTHFLVVTVSLLDAAGRMPVSLLYMPRAMRGTRGSAGGLYGTAGSTGRQLRVDDAFGGFADEALLLLESRLHRPHTHACQVRDFCGCHQLRGDPNVG